MDVDPETAAQTANIVNLMEAVARNTCTVSGLDGEAFALGKLPGLPRFKWWQVYFQENLFAAIKPLPPHLKQAVFCAAMDRLSQTVVECVPDVTH